MSHDLGAAAMRGRRTALAVTWTEGRDGALRATWCPLRFGPFDLDVRSDGPRWVATVERVHPRLHRRAPCETRDEGQLWCEEKAWELRAGEVGL